MQLVYTKTTIPNKKDLKNHNQNELVEFIQLLKKEVKAYRKNGMAPGDDQLITALKKYRATKEKNDKRHEEVLESIAQMLFDPNFQELLKHSSPAEIDSNVQKFLS